MLLFPTRSVLFPYLPVYRGFRPLTGLPERERHPLAGAVPELSTLPAVLSGRYDGRAAHPFVALDPGSYR